MNYQKDRRSGRRHLGKNYPSSKVRENGQQVLTAAESKYDQDRKLSTGAVSNGILGPKARLQQI